MNKAFKVGEIVTMTNLELFPMRATSRQQGASLIMVLLILVVVSVLGAGGAQIAIMSERGARNDRDQQVAWQAAEAALIDAEVDMIDTTSTRQTVFDSKNLIPFETGCGTTGNSVGLCALNLTGKPAWLTADFTIATGTSVMTTGLGAFTGRTFAAGVVGIQPAQVPRYVIEIIPDPIGDKSKPTFMYRVTAMGFGPRQDIQAVVQMIYRI